MTGIRFASLSRYALSNPGQIAWTNIALQGLGVFSGLLLARALSPADRGLLLALTVWTQTTGWLASLSAPAWVTREVARGADANSRIGTALRLTAPAAIVLAALAIAVVVLSVERLSSLGPLLPVALAGGAFATVISDLFIAKFLGQRRYNPYNAARALAPIIYLVLIVAVVILGDLTLTSAAVAWLAALLFAAVVLWLKGGPVDFKTSGTVHDLRAFVIRVHPGTAINTANLRIDALICSVVVSATATGFYAIAAGYAQALNAIGSVIGTVTLPELSRADPADRARMLKRAVIRTLVITAGGAIALAAAAPVVVPWLFGVAYSSAVFPAQILVVAGVPYALAGTYTSASVAADDPIGPTIAETIALLVGVPIIVVGLLTVGIVGAAFGSLIGYAVTALVLYLRLRKRLPQLPLSGPMP